MVFKAISLPVRREIRESLRLAIPLASAQIAQAATGFIDTVMMGWLGQTTLAAGGLAAATFTALLISVSGIVMGVSPLISEAFGGGNKERVQQVTRQGLWLSVLLTIPLTIAIAHIDSLMHQLGQAAVTVSLGKTYLDTIVWGFFPALAFAMLRSVVSALSQPRAIAVIVIIGSLFNAAGNYILGFGKLGFPALGLAGLGLASAISHWVMFLCLVCYTFKNKQLRLYRLFENLPRFEPKVIRELLWIGVPIGISFALETGLFTVTTYFMGMLGTQVLAAHQIVLQTIVVIFMIPLGMSFAATIRVGQWNGQDNSDGVRRAGYVNMCMGAGFMTVMAILLLVFPQQAIAIYLDIRDPENHEAIAIATSMLSVAALAQILDGLQSTAAGALRGLKDTRIPVLLSFLAFWCVGLTSGYLLGFRLGFGGVGLWLGQSIGVAMAAGVFIYRFRLLTL